MNTLKNLLPIAVAGTAMALFSGCVRFDGSPSAQAKQKAAVVKPTSPNAFNDYMAAARLMKDADRIQKAIAASTEERPNRIPLKEKEALIRKNTAALKRIREGFSLPYHEPALKTTSPEWVHYGKLRALARLLLLEGLVRASKGDHEGAMNSYLDAIHLGEHIQHGSVLIGMLVGVAIQHIGRRNVWETVDHLSAGEALKASQRLKKISELHYPFWRIIQGEKRFALDNFESELQRLKQEGQQNEVEEWADTDGDDPYLKAAERFGERGTLDRYLAYLDDLTHATRNRFIDRPRYPLPNHDPLIIEMGPVVDLSWMKELINLTQNRLLAVTLALRAYHAENGNYPETLKELTPVYLKDLPVDPFGRNGFGYRRDGSKYVLYSIGPDGQDNGGKPIYNPPDETHRNPPEHVRRFILPESKGDIVAGVNVS